MPSPRTPSVPPEVRRLVLIVAVVVAPAAATVPSAAAAGGPTVDEPAVERSVPGVTASAADAPAAPPADLDAAPVRDLTASAPVRNRTASGVQFLSVLRGDRPLYGRLDDFEAVSRARETGNLTEPEPLRLGETLVVTFASPALNRTVANRSGPNTTVRSYRALNATNASVAVRKREAECGLRWNLPASRTRVLRDPDGGRFAVVVDTGRLRFRSDCDGPPDPLGEFEVTVSVPGGQGRPSDSRFLPVRGPDVDRPRGAGDVTVRRGAPGLAGRLTDASAVRGALAAGRLVDGDRTVRGETLVLTLRSERLNRSHASVDGPTTTARFRRALNATGGNVSVRSELGYGVGAGRLRLGGPGVRVLRDPGNATFHLVVDGERARLGTRAGGSVRLANATASTYYVRLHVPDGEPSAFAGRFLLDRPEGRLVVVRNESTHPDGVNDVVVVAPGGRLTVRGETNLAPGTNLTLRFRAGGGTLATRRLLAGGEAGPSGEWAFEQRLRAAPSAGSGFTVELRRDGDTLAVVDGVAGRRPTLRNATLERVDGTDSRMVRFEVTARYPAPGFVVVQGADGFVGYPVPGGRPTRVNGTAPLSPSDGEEPGTVRLIGVYDANRNGTFDGPRREGPTDPPFQESDGGLLDQEVSLPTPTPSPSPTAVPPGTTLPVTGDGGGFGVGSGLVALLVACLLARRR